MSASASIASSTNSTPGEQSGAVQIATLMEQVKAKDALVLQLTERLEAAAEQLDRIQRTGGDRRHPGSGGGSRELAEQLTGRVEEALEAWGQTSSHYDVILQRLDEIADHLQGSGAGTTSSAARSGGSTSAKSSATSAPASSSAGAGQGSFWEKMKASMVDGTSPPAMPAPSQTAVETHNEPESSETVVQERSLENIAPPPTVINVDTASIEDLREAVAARDAYISTLISELRMAQPLPPLPTDLQNCDWAPEDLVMGLRQLEQKLKTEVQREGLELSLERARMARERMRLDQVKAQLEEQIKRLSMAAAGAAPAEAAPANTEQPVASGKLSWLKRLQPKKS